MSGDIDEIKRELEEVRRLKEELKEELESMRSSRPKLSTRPRRIVVEPPQIDLSGLTEGLEDMMQEITTNVMEVTRGVDSWKDGRRVRMHRNVHRRMDSSEIESIPPDRVAEVINPLGSEERLKILDTLKEGAKTFNELEQRTGRTGSSLTHHLNPLIEAGYVIKGEMRGTYYVTVEGRLAYRLAQWLTSRVERERAGQTRAADDEGDYYDDTF
jgi:DNA-binding transcriptional ArsR family regulator